MKYSVDIEIDLPRARVVELFDNPDNLKHWQPGLVSFEAISGVPGEPGGRSRLRYQMGKKEIDVRCPGLATLDRRRCRSFAAPCLSPRFTGRSNQRLLL